MIPPPPRLIMLGVPGSGKQTLINQLLTEYAHTGITHVTWEEYLLEYKDRQEKELREEIEYAIKENAGVLGTVVLVDILKSLFFGEVRHHAFNCCKTPIILTEPYLHSHIREPA